MNVSEEVASHLFSGEVRLYFGAITWVNRALDEDTHDEWRRLNEEPEAK